MKTWQNIVVLSLTMVLTGCVETIVMDPDEKDLPVAVNCILSNPDPYRFYDYTQTYSSEFDKQRQSMTIRYVKGKSEDGYVPVEDAVVYIDYESGPKDDPKGTISFVHVGDGLWESDSVRIYNCAKYSLFVEIPGKETIWAETTGLSDVSCGLYVPDEVLSYDEEKTKEFIIKHPFHFNYDGRSYPVWVFAKEYTNQGWKDLEYLVTDSPYADDFNVTGKHFSDMSILGKEDTSDSTDGKIRDVFDSSKRLMPDLPLHERFIRMEKIDTVGTVFVSAGPLWYLNLESNDYYGKYDNIQVGWDLYVDETGKLVRKPIYEKRSWTWNQFIRIHFHFVNSDLDEYLRSIYVQEQGSRNSLTSLYSTANTFTNIHGGVGIFGCENQLVLYLIDYRLI